MRMINDVAELTTLLIGTGAVGETHYGAPFDTLGFNDALAVLMVGAVGGTNGSTATVTLKFQEGLDPAGVGTQWADITDGALQGSWSMALTVVAGSSPLADNAIAEILADGNRKRYIRPHIAVAGTDACNPVYSVGIIAGHPVDTEKYVTGGTTTGTGNADFSQ